MWYMYVQIRHLKPIISHISSTSGIKVSATIFYWYLNMFHSFTRKYRDHWSLTLSFEIILKFLDIINIIVKICLCVFWVLEHRFIGMNSSNEINNSQVQVNRYIETTWNEEVQLPIAPVVRIRALLNSVGSCRNVNSQK